MHAIEPVPINADHLLLSARLNGIEAHFTLYRAAASTADGGWLVMRVQPSETGRSHVVRSSTRNNRYYAHSKKVGKAATWQTVRVPVARVDSLLREVGQVDLLKVDVEGSEMAAVCSATQLLAPGRVQHVGLELNPETLPDNDARRILRVLAKAGYSRVPVAGIVKPGSGLSWANYFRQGGGAREKIYMGVFTRGAPRLYGAEHLLGEPAPDDCAVVAAEGVVSSLDPEAPIDKGQHGVAAAAETAAARRRGGRVGRPAAGAGRVGATGYVRGPLDPASGAMPTSVARAARARATPHPAISLRARHGAEGRQSVASERAVWGGWASWAGWGGGVMAGAVAVMLLWCLREMGTATVSAVGDGARSKRAAARAPQGCRKY